MGEKNNDVKPLSLIIVKQRIKDVIIEAIKKYSGKLDGKDYFVYFSEEGFGVVIYYSFDIPETANLFKFVKKELENSGIYIHIVFVKS
jgi:hypothetical protein